MLEERMRALLIVAAGGILVAAVLVLVDHRPSAPTRPQAAVTDSYARLVAANYRVLTPAQTQRLLRFSNVLHDCLAKRGFEVGRPVAANTRIELAIPADADRHRLSAAAIACGDQLGGPPTGASLQLRPHVRSLLLYLPKRCLLDRKTVAGA
jgi:hypothetical protein